MSSIPVMPWVRAAGAALIVTAPLALGGCASTPDVGQGLTEPIQFRAPPGASVVIDGRAAFRHEFCTTLRAEGIAAAADSLCERWLWRLVDEPVADATQDMQAASAASLEVLLVTGAFSECVGESSRPFSAGAARLRAAGAEVRTIVVSGRSGTSYNARQISEAMTESLGDEHRRVILVGYSKGGLDILRFLVDYPELAARVDAVVVVASPVFGTPLADMASSAYATLGSKVPNDRCPPGDGEVIASLTPAAATEWLAANPLPAHVRYYSLVAFTTREHVGRALAPFWKHLGGTRVRNDGQVVATDAVIPGSTLLGYANADHWGIAQTIETEHPVLASRPDPQLFPLEQLFVALVKFVAYDLEHGPARGPVSPAVRPEEVGR